MLLLLCENKYLKYSRILNEYSYYASCSGLYQQTRLSLFGIEIQLEGYNHKLPILVERVCQEIANLSNASNTILTNEKKSKEYIDYFINQNLK